MIASTTWMGYSIANYMVHQPYGFSTPEAEMNAMADLVEAGKIRSVGISNFSPDRMRQGACCIGKKGPAAGGKPGEV